MRKKRKTISEMNVVPYIDVMLVLLVIFMVTTPMMRQGIEVDLPKASNTAINNDDSTQKIITVSIDANGLYYWSIGNPVDTEIDNASHTLEQLTNAVTTTLENNKDAKLLIMADQSVSYGVVMNVMSNLQNAGATNIGLITEEPTK